MQAFNFIRKRHLAILVGVEVYLKDIRSRNFIMDRSCDCYWRWRNKVLPCEPACVAHLESIREMSKMGWFQKRDKSGG